MNQTMQRFLTALVICVWASPVIAAAAPSDSERARQYVEQGDAYFDSNRFEEARTELLKAFKLLKWPTIALRAAQAHDKSGKLVEAASMYRKAIALQPDDSWPKKPENKQLLQNAQRDAKTELAALLPRVPTLKVEITGDTAADLEITIDGTPLPSGVLTTPRELNPGSHTVAATTKDGRNLSQSVALAEREHKTVAFDVAKFPPLPQTTPASAPQIAVVSPAHGYIAPHQPEESRPQRNLTTLGWIGLGVGAAGVAVGATAGIVSLVKKSNLEDAGCKNYKCPDNVYPTVRTGGYDTWRTVSTVGFVVGGIGAAAAGVTLLLVEPKHEASPQISMMIAPSTVGVHGAF